VRIGAVNSLPSGWTYQRVIVQRRHHPHTARPRHGRQIERQVEQTVQMDDVGLDGAQHVRDAIGHQRRAVGILERGASAVVRDLDDRHAFMHAPGDMPMRPGRIELRAQHADVMARRQLAAELEGVDLRASLVAGQKIVNDVKDVQMRIIASGISDRRQR
jgi:hypothetical protein